MGPIQAYKKQKYGEGTMKRRTFIRACALALAAVGGLLALGPSPALAAYPERPITMIVPWGAGGGTDATARIISSLLERTLGQPINVVNRTGGSGVVGHQAIASSAPMAIRWAWRPWKSA